MSDRGPARQRTPSDPGAFGDCWQRSAARFESFGRRVARATGWQVWNPGQYGEVWHAPFRETYRLRPQPLVFFGLNPGPYGMAQTGLPFTDVKRLRAALPRLCARLEHEGARVEVPGLAPRTLRPYLTRTFESSSVRVYRFLELTFGSAENGFERLAVANPCPLLFMDREAGRNRTPADLQRAVRARGKADPGRLQSEMNRLREENAADTVQSLRPCGAVLLGKDAQAALAPTLTALLGPDRVVPWEHPARAVPERWARGLRDELMARQLGELSGCA